MNKEQLSDAIGNISDEHIEAKDKRTDSGKNRALKAFSAIAALLALAVTAVLEVNIFPASLVFNATVDAPPTSSSATPADLSKYHSLIESSCP